MTLAEIPALTEPDNEIGGAIIIGMFALACLALAGVGTTMLILRWAGRVRAGRHQCPREGCTRTVPYRELMCRADWALVPLPLQRAVTDAWRGGKGRGTAEHYAAMAAAVIAADRAVRGDVGQIGDDIHRDGTPVAPGLEDELRLMLADWDHEGDR